MTIPEMLIAMTLFVGMMVAVDALLNQGMRVWHRTSGSESAALQIKRAQRYLERDLLEANYAKSRTGLVPAHLGGGGKDGSALWFLSARGPDGKLMHSVMGPPTYQRNVLYYLVVPAGHTSCAGISGADQMDEACPHKLLIRKVIDSGLPTPGPDPLASLEVLLAADQVTAYLTQPAGHNVSAMMAEPGVQQVEVVASDLLTFQVKKGPEPGVVREIQIDLKAVSLEDARREVQVGAVSLARGRYTLEQLFSVFPRN